MSRNKSIYILHFKIGNFISTEWRGLQSRLQCWCKERECWYIPLTTGTYTSSQQRIFTGHLLPRKFTSHRCTLMIRRVNVMQQLIVIVGRLRCGKFGWISRLTSKIVRVKGRGLTVPLLACSSLEKTHSVIIYLNLNDSSVGHKRCFGGVYEMLLFLSFLKQRASFVSHYIRESYIFGITSLRVNDDWIVLFLPHISFSILLSFTVKHISPKMHL